MMSSACWFIILVASLAVGVFPSAAADKIDSSHCLRTVRSSSRVSERKCEEYTRGTTCMSSYDDIDPTVVEDAKLGEFPHLAFIATNISRPIQYTCTGSLISPRFIITTASCVNVLYPQTLYVSLGDHNIDPSVDDGANPVQVPIKAILRHPEYKSPKTYNNIALLELASELAFNANIRPACLASEEPTVGHTKAMISTIDRTLDKELKQLVIQKVSATIEDNDLCNTSFPLNRRLNHGIDATQMCAQEATGNNSLCKAMGGSPLQVVSNGADGCAFHILGLTSYGFSYCNEKPTVFTRVSSYMDWIESVVWPAE